MPRTTTRLDHIRALRRRLGDAGIEVTRVWVNRHVRLRLRRGAREATITIACSPAVPEHAVNAAMQHARRAFR